MIGNNCIWIILLIIPDNINPNGSVLATNELNNPIILPLMILFGIDFCSIIIRGMFTIIIPIAIEKNNITNKEKYKYKLKLKIIRLEVIPNSI